MQQTRNQSGFGVIEVILVIVVLALIAVGGWYVWNANQNSPSTASGPLASSGASTSAASIDPYAGWKSYCDTANGVCFKYPTDWTLTEDKSDFWASADIQNPSKSVQVRYSSYDTRDGTEFPYYTSALEDPATPNAAFKVVGGFVPSSGGSDVVPQYKVVDKKFTTGLKDGQQTTMVNTARFTIKGNSTYSLEARPTSTSGFDETKAKAWFKTDDAKTVELVVRSFYVQ